MSDATSKQMNQNDNTVVANAHQSEIKSVLEIMAAALDDTEKHLRALDTASTWNAEEGVLSAPRQKRKHSWQADLCAALVYGATAEEEEAKGVPPIVQLPLNKRDGMDETHFAAILDTLLSTKRQEADSSRHDAEVAAGWLPHLLTPLFERWTEQKIQRMVQTQHPEGAPTSPPIEDSAYDFMDGLATVVHTKLVRAYVQRDREMSQANMDLLFRADEAEPSSPTWRDATPLQPLKERLRQLVEKTTPRQQLSLAADLMSTFGAFASACGSYRMLCMAAFTLLRLSLAWCLQDVRLAALEEMVLQREKLMKSGNTPADEGVKEEGFTQERSTLDAGGRAKVRRFVQIRQTHYVHQLMSFWMGLFGRFGGESLYVKEPHARERQEDKNDTRPTKPFIFSETDWIFLVLVTLYVENNMLSFVQPSEALTSDGAPAPSRASVRDTLAVEALSSLLSNLLQSLLAYATTQLQCAPLAAKPLSFVSAVLCRRPFVWEMLRDVDVLARKLTCATVPMCASAADDEETFRAHVLRPLQERWGSLVGLYTALTDVRPPAQAQGNRSGANETNALLTFNAYREKMTALFKMEREKWGDPLALESSGEVSASVTLSKRLEYLCLLEKLVQWHASNESSWGVSASLLSPNRKRSREALQEKNEEKEEKTAILNSILHTDAFLEQVCYMTPFEKYTRYMCEFFLPLYDEKCFTLFLPERQRRLTRVLQSLQRRIERREAGPSNAAAQEEGHCEEAITAAMKESHREWRATDAEYENPFLLPAPPTATTTTPPKPKEDEEEEEVLWSSDDEAEEKLASPPPAAAAFSLTKSASWLHEHTMLRQESKLVMLVAHSTFVLLQRFGGISAEDQDALVENIIPLLLHLSETSQDKWRASATVVLPGGPPQWLQWRCSRFCLYAFIVAEVVSIKWDLKEVGLMWLRYQMLVTHMLDRCEVDGGGSANPNNSNSNGSVTTTLIDRALPELESWVREGGGSPKSRAYGTHVAAFLQEVDSLLQEQNPIYATMNAKGTVTKAAVLDQCLRCVTPLRPPPACALLLVLSAYRAMSQRLQQLRTDLEEQRRLAGEEGNWDYVGRTETYCTAQDVSVLRTIVLSVHRCVFGYTLQSLGLLRLWLGYLAHLLGEVVPRPQSTEAMQLMPRSWQLDGDVLNCLGERVHRVGWRALRPSSEQSSQTALRVVVGELLADLALLPLADPTAPQDCHYVFPVDRPYAEPAVQALVTAERAAAAHDSAVLQRLLPVAVLEDLCLFLKIETGRKVEAPVANQRAAGTRLEESFLGLAGVCAFCRRWESCALPGSVTDPRVAHLLRCVWAAVDAVVVSG